MEVKIARAGRIIGTYSASDIHRFVQEGGLLITDNYWREGMKEWRPVSELIGSRPVEKKVVNESNGWGFWDVITLGLLSGWLSSGSRSDSSGDDDYITPRPGPNLSEEDLDERLADIAEDERELMADDDRDYDGDGDGDA